MMASISKEEDLELENQLKLINKPPLKTIQTTFGYIIDCIDIHKQLAFDNPLLKNHKIQLRPSFEPATTLNEDQRSARLSSIGIEDDLCPTRTVPVRRTTKEDLIRVKYLSNNNGILTKDAPGSHFAAVNLNPDGIYYGIRGSINVFNPKVGSREQMSAAYIYLAKGQTQFLNSIMAGWQVYPEMYGDTKTHVFIGWANKQNQTGCYNLLCPGFVQTNNIFRIGGFFTNMSTYDGQQFEMIVAIFKDVITDSWWLRLAGEYLGYFPGSLFSDDMSYADGGGWYGRTTTPAGGLSPPMGSGHLPDGEFGHACFIRVMAFVNQTGEYMWPEMKSVGIYTDNPNCYGVQYTGYVDEAMLYSMQFGGPGGNCGY
ncbi:hypothetical protein RIF29_37565 [Crotalaria pallida]|uniref:Neprosin PEP catalytic domain-containing protein n=1 Tax=Crotalaria pallida TaxID=3830 RepID=A0AAN9ECK5_CROPI